MHQQQLQQEPELENGNGKSMSANFQTVQHNFTNFQNQWNVYYLSNGIVRSQSSLQSFPTTDTNTHMSSLQEVDSNLIIGKGKYFYTCIMLTSLAPSPIARVIESFTFSFTNLTTSAF